jgi:hypothetical protein
MLLLFLLLRVPEPGLVREPVLVLGLVLVLLLGLVLVLLLGLLLGLGMRLLLVLFLELPHKSSYCQIKVIIQKIILMQLLLYF